MKKALNQHNKLVDIIESTKDDIYICPVCKEILTRNFGVSRQFYSHPSSKGDECELKLKLMVKDGDREFDEKEIDILNREYYNKTFDDVNIELSDYMSEEGYYLTQEQKNIIFAEEDRIKIAALAGSAKTSTLYYYAKERRFKKILYLVYNKAMKDECDQIFKNIRNTEIRTIHSLAYQRCGKFYKDKLTLNYGVVDVIKDLKLKWNKDMEIAVKIHEMMKQYTLSDVLDFSDINLFKDQNGNTTKERELIIQYCRKLWDLQLIYDNNYKITHDTYLKMFHLSKTTLDNKYDVIMLDECLPKSQLVKTDKESIPINKLYDWYIQGKSLPKALSYNIDKDIFEYKPIVWAKKSKNRQLLEITTEGLNKLQCTENHKILTQRGYVKAEDLIIGNDSVILDGIENQKTKYKPNKDQIQIILGSFLGDGHLQKMSKFNTYRLSFTQGEKQFEYFKSKISAFDLDYRLIESGYTHELSIYSSNPTKVFLLEKDIWELMNDINEMGLAIWYQDDGSYTNNRCTINSNQLTYEETEYMRNILKDKYDINFITKLSKGKYYYLRADKENSDKFIDLIHKYMHPIMQYKSYIDISNNIITYNNKYLNHGGNYIKSIEKIHSEDVYDIEIKDNHNFVTTRSRSEYKNKSGVSSSGIVVHNCQDSNLLVLDILKSSNVPGAVIVGDQYQNLYGFRGATNIMPLFEGKEYQLTTSFRVSQNIANIVNIMIKDMCKVDIDMKGFNTKQKIVDKIDKSKPYVCLCRTNANIFGEVVDVIDRNPNINIFFEGHFQSYQFNNILDGFYFYKGHKVKNPLFNKFKDYSNMLEYAKKITDLELLAIDRMIERYSSRIPTIIESIKNNIVKSKSMANVIFSTCHRAKGQTYSIPVYISDDYFNINDVFKKEYIDTENKDNFDIIKFQNEVYVLYVAITRCAAEIELNDKLKDYLITRYNYFKNNK